MNDPETLIRCTWYSHTIMKYFTLKCYMTHLSHFTLKCYMTHLSHLTLRCYTTLICHLTLRTYMTPGLTGGSVRSVSILSHTEYHNLSTSGKVYLHWVTHIQYIVNLSDKLS